MPLIIKSVKILPRQVSRMDRKEAIEYWEEFLEEIPEIEGMPQEEKDKQEQATLMAIAALQEPERIIKQLEELRDEPLMYCSEDYWEGHYIAAKEAIAIVRGEEE